MTSLRIVHVSNEAYGFDTANGVQQVVYSLAAAQAKLGHAVAVVSRDDNAVHRLGDGAESAFPPSRPVRTRRRRSLPEQLLSRYLEHRVLDSVLTWHPDIVHFHSVHIPENVVLAPHLRRAGIPYCVTVHGALCPQALRRGWARKAAFNLFFERRYLNQARFIHAVSPHEIDGIRRFGVVRPIVTVPNGLPPESAVRATNPGALLVGHPSYVGGMVFMFVGRLDPWQKGLDLLLEAFARATLSDATLVLVGPDWRGSRAELEHRADSLGISSKVVFTGPAFGEDRANLLAAADVFVHPSRWEGLSLSVLMAADAGKACLITRDADPLGELGRSGAAMIVDATVTSIADGLKRSSAMDAAERQEIGERARDVAREHFAWPAIAGRLADAYRGSS